MTASPKWTPDQSTALDKIGRWLRERDKQVFRLFGFAGTGKTTLARHIAESVRRVVFCAPTAKAARSDKTRRSRHT